MAEQLICNQQVGGSSPSTSSKKIWESTQVGQRGQTVNLLSVTSVVRIRSLPPEKSSRKAVFSMKFALRECLICVTVKNGAITDENIYMFGGEGVKLYHLRLSLCTRQANFFVLSNKEQYTCPVNPKHHKRLLEFCFYRLSGL